MYYLGDANFNITTLVYINGDPLERYVYSPYGALTIYDGSWSNLRSASSYAVEYTYTGRRLDGETGLYYYRHRMYHAQLGRFASRDPMLYVDTCNLQEYVASSPTIRVDASGQKFWGCTPVPPGVYGPWGRWYLAPSALLSDVQHNMCVYTRYRWRQLDCWACWIHYTDWESESDKLQACKLPTNWTVCAPTYPNWFALTTAIQNNGGTCPNVPTGPRPTPSGGRAPYPQYFYGTR